MLNIKKAFTVSGILLNSFVFLSLIIMFCWLGNVYAQMPPALDFPPGREFDPRHPLEPRESGISPSAISENVEFVGATGGMVHDVFVQGNYAYIHARGILVILDVSAPSHPTVIGCAVPQIVSWDGGLYIQGSLAYVADVNSGLRIIDVSSPSSPVEVGFYDTPGYARDVYVQSGLAYVADGSLRIIDVSVPSSPSEVGFYNTPGGALGVYVQGSLAYVADYQSGLRIIDVSVPSSPVEVGFYDTPGSAEGVYVQGGFAYVADSSSGLRIIDVNVPSSPTEVGFYDTPGSAGDVYVQSGLAYVADGSLRIIDVSVPSSPSEVGFHETLWAYGVYVQGGLAYVADYFSGLRIIDVSVPSSPSEVGFYDTPGSARGVYVQGGFAYVADAAESGFGLRIIDVSSPSSPVEVGFHETPSSATGVYVQGSFAYVADSSSGLRIIDVSDPSSPFEVGFYDTPPFAEGVYVQGSLAYVADNQSGLRIIDVSVPSSPVEVGFYDTPGYAYGVYVQGGLAYVADYLSGLRIIDVSVPSSPVEVGFYDTPGYAYGVYVQGGLAYVADYHGLRIIDVSVPSSPFEVGFYDTPDSARDVYVQGGLAYVASSGLRVIDVSDPSSPIELGFYDTPSACGVYVQGSLTYVTDNCEGLIILRYTGGEPDTTPPSAITDLATSDPTPDSIMLTWTAPGDDGDVGVASEYDIRYSISPIDEGNWDSATQVVGEPTPSPAGTNEFFTVTGLSTDTTYYFAMKTADEVPNWSELSNVASVNLLLAQYEPILYLYGGELGDEVYRPMNVDAYVAECSLWHRYRIPGRPDIHKLILDVGEVTLEALSDFGEDDYLKFVQDLDKLNTPDHNKAKVRYESIADKKATCYARIKPDGDYTVLQYWFFDAFNYWGEVEDGFNNHEGDWEMIVLFLKGDMPEYVAYSSHHNEGAVTRRRWTQIEKEGEHPIVYVALGSHANYFTTGEILVTNPIFFDHTSNAGIHIGPGEDIEWHHGSNYILNDDNLPGWVDSYAGLWGVDYKSWDLKAGEPPSVELTAHFPTDGPNGPKYSSGGEIRKQWSNPIEWADIPGDVSITIESFSNFVPQGGTLEIEMLVINNSSTDFGLVRIGIDILGLIDIPNLKWFKLGPLETIPITGSVTMPIKATLGVYTVVLTCEDIPSLEQLTQEAFNFEITSPVADVGEIANLAPPVLRTSVSQNYPNPFNPDTWIPYGLAQDANVTISIYNAKGQLIRTLNLGEQKAGIYVSKDKTAYWDGRDNSGEKVASGVYFYTLQVEYQSQQGRGKFYPDEKAGSFRMTRKMVILK